MCSLVKVNKSTFPKANRMTYIIPSITPAPTKYHSSYNSSSMKFTGYSFGRAGCKERKSNNSMIGKQLATDPKKTVYYIKGLSK